MSLIFSGMRRGFVVARSFSTAESPKITLARNILLLKKISEAKDEAALSKINLSELPALDASNPPKELEDFTSYFELSKVQATEKFVPDPTAWQNMAPLDYAATELKRDETWPFFVGIVVMLFLGLGLNMALPNSARANSKYIQMLEGKSTHGEQHHDHAEAHKAH